MCIWNKHVFLGWNTTTLYTYSSAVNHVRFLNLFHRMGWLVPAHNKCTCLQNHTISSFMTVHCYTTRNERIHMPFIKVHHPQNEIFHNTLELKCFPRRPGKIIDKKTHFFLWKKLLKPVFPPQYIERWTKINGVPSFLQKEHS
jgi:hypothetical protein